jgi:hypothetical protein
MRTIQGWRKARPQLERWRRSLARLRVSLKRARPVDATAVDLASGEPIAPGGPPQSRFRAQLVYFTPADATLRRPSGALLVIDTYELDSLTDGKTRVLP